MLSKLKQVWKIFFPDPPTKGFDSFVNASHFDKLTSSINLLGTHNQAAFALCHKINNNLCLNMRLHSASNGMILEITSTDYAQTNPNTSTLHVLSNETLGEDLQRIILLELLKK